MTSSPGSTPPRPQDPQAPPAEDVVAAEDPVEPASSTTEGEPAEPSTHDKAATPRP